MNAYNAGFLFGMICTLSLFVIIGVAVSAVVMKAACSVCQEEPPTFGSAMGISFLQLLSGAGIGFVARIVVSGTIASNPNTIQVASALISLPFSMLAAASIIHKMVPTSAFSKAVLIWLAQILIGVLMIVIMAFSLGLVIGGLRQGG